MRWARSKGLWLALVVCTATVVGLLSGSPPEDPAVANIRRLVEQLGDDEYARREAANKELEQLGDTAVPLLRQALDGNDPEIRVRSRQLLLDIARQVKTSKSIGLKLVTIEPGEFQMGSLGTEATHGADELQHKVRITKPYYLGVNEVTQEEFAKVMERSPSFFQVGGGGEAKLVDKDTRRHPVENVSWYDALEFCNRLSKLDGFEPHYELTDVVRENDSIKSAKVAVLGGKGYRLPTEAEWEFACRAETTSPFHFGFANTGRESNVKATMRSGGYGGDVPAWAEYGRTTKVGDFAANGWGLQDMHGNVAEWCWDWYDGAYYSRSPPADPTGGAAGRQRVLRGGSWMVLEGNCRSATRYYATPDERKNYVGFRVARSE